MPQGSRRKGADVVGVSEQQRLALGDKLYEQYARPLEAEHWGSSLPSPRMGVSSSVLHYGM
jgi:hypothetical protein